MSIDVRPIREGDFFAWLDLYAKYAEFCESELTDQKALTLWSWLTDAQHEESGYVAVDDGRLVGLAHVREFARPLEGDRGLFLDDLFVLETERGHGIGHDLIQAIRSLAKERSLGAVQWIADHDNAHAQRVYDSVASRTSWVTYEIDLVALQNGEKS
ncbi:acetyltransferase [Leifsonia xyli subsp. cynodontis DSM 46306]|uniref:N-acetyltransferase domain-containing protein n=1 Tax=Leifsonia xyli subsp. cynodontis DSM 46306 TaxID=1389489 RepID=U3P9N2_LEIXC|nr:GNAT family N-acetyltransferase [Leifsonia xyli]AGW41577.1 acetyltransferase [Leifsonia xyli subsp. cynodontis DSM 46306]